MEQKRNPLSSACNFSGIKPIMADLPYPVIEVRRENQQYADLLSVDYCGSVSELSAIMQYINNENRLSCEKCPVAKILLGIAKFSIKRKVIMFFVVQNLKLTCYVG